MVWLYPITISIVQFNDLQETKISWKPRQRLLRTSIIIWNRSTDYFHKLLVLDLKICWWIRGWESNVRIYYVVQLQDPRITFSRLSRWIIWIYKMNETLGKAWVMLRKDCKTSKKNKKMNPVLCKLYCAMTRAEWKLSKPGLMDVCLPPWISGQLGNNTVRLCIRHIRHFICICICVYVCLPKYLVN